MWRSVNGVVIVGAFALAMASASVAHAQGSRWGEVTAHEQQFSMAHAGAVNAWLADPSDERATELLAMDRAEVEWLARLTPEPCFADWMEAWSVAVLLEYAAIDLGRAEQGAGAAFEWAVPLAIDAAATANAAADRATSSCQP